MVGYFYSRKTGAACFEIVFVNSLLYVWSECNTFDPERETQVILVQAFFEDLSQNIFGENETFEHFNFLFVIVECI